MGLFDPLKPFICEPEMGNLKYDRAQLLTMLEECKAVQNAPSTFPNPDLIVCRQSLDTVRKNYAELQADFNACESSLAKLPHSDPQEKFWNEKYPTANIEYLGRVFPTTKETIPIDVRLLITPSDFHLKKILDDNGLNVTGSNYDETAIKIWKFVKTKWYKYTYDQQNYGIGELWEFPFEMLAKLTNGYDCDSWAVFQASLYIAAGIPAWKVRVVAGKCDLGGHCTVYVHSSADDKFHHLNSTYGADWKELKDAPLPPSGPNSGDALGIYDVWFSFNQFFSWHQFSTAAEDSFIAHEKAKLFRIVTEGE